MSKRTRPSGRFWGQHPAFGAACAAVLGLGCCVGLPAAEPDATEPQAAEPDPRSGAAVTLHDDHPFRPIGDAEAWPARREAIRTRVRLAAGLLPYPQRTPLNPRLGETVDGNGFSVTPIALESFPGHYVTGSLFRPIDESLDRGLRQGRRPAVLCPHGHWEDGRFYDLLARGGERAVREQIAIGAERFESAARNPILARCVQLARMGCVVLVYDMIGYADSIQLSEHRRGPRPDMNRPEPGRWGFVSPQASLRLQTNFGLQTWNSVRVLDYLADLDEVDPDRILVTGASGGATQTMVLAAIDERVSAAFPCVMASTAMQGGCTCENSHYLRIDQGNIDIAAAVAPRPLGLTAADDWTVELETKGHPDLVGLYQMLGVPDRYEAHFNTWFQHNYNHVSRTQMYQFANRHLGLGLESPVLERDYEFLSPDRLTVWGDVHPRPANDQIGDSHEREVNRIWATDSARQLAAAFDAAKRGDRDPAERLIRRGWETILGRGPVKTREIAWGLGEAVPVADGSEATGLIHNRSHSERVAASVHFPDDWDGEVTIRLGPPEHPAGPPEHPAGVNAAAAEAAEQKPAGPAPTILVPTLYAQGDDGSGNQATTYSGRDDVADDSWQRSPVYYYGYNDPTFVRQVHDLLTVIAASHDLPNRKTDAVRIEADGKWAAVALAARAIAGAAVDELSVDLDGFRFADVADPFDAAMVPGAVKYGDVMGLAMLNIPHRLVWRGTDVIGGQMIRALYEAAGSPDAFGQGQGKPVAVADEPAPPDPEHVVVHFGQDRFAGWPANHGIWNWGDEIVVGFTLGHHKEKEGHTIDPDRPAHPMQARSLDGGQSWQVERPSYLLADGREPEPRAPVGGIDFTHPDFAITFRMEHSNEGYSYYYHSADRCRTWQGPYRLPTFGRQGIFARTDYLIEGPHQMLAFMTAAKDGGGEGWPFAARTDDGGLTWRHVGWIGPQPGGTDYSIMPSVLRPSPGTLFAVIRRRGQQADGSRRWWLESFRSPDDGRSWDPLDAPTIDNAGNPPHLIDLADGRWVLTYGYRREPYGIRARLSEDRGVTWGPERILRDDGGGWDLGYPRTVQRADGRLVTVYYFQDGRRKERHLAATLWDAP